MAAALTTLKRLSKQTLTDLVPTYCHTQLSAAVSRGWSIDPSLAYCHRCGASAGPGAVTATGCSFCLGKPIPWNSIVRLSPYTDPVTDWILSMKFHGAWIWGRWFGRRLAKAVGPLPHHPRVAVCPVPMHWTRRAYRGYNQAHLIANAFAHRRRWPLVHLLRRTRLTPPQTHVSPASRSDNVRHSFAAEPFDLSSWHIWLVDDVKTSGATLAACARMLRRAGASSIHVAVVAVANHHPHHSVLDPKPSCDILPKLTPAASPPVASRAAAPPPPPAGPPVRVEASPLGHETPSGY